MSEQLYFSATELKQFLAYYQHCAKIKPKLQLPWCEVLWEQLADQGPDHAYKFIASQEAPPYLTKWLVDEFAPGRDYKAIITPMKITTVQH